MNTEGSENSLRTVQLLMVLHRLMVLMHNVPTDADYAMELIAQRVARGQEIKPLSRKRKNAKKVDVNGSPDVPSRDVNDDGKAKGFLKQSVSALKTVADTGYQAIGGQQVSGLPDHHPAREP